MESSSSEYDDAVEYFSDDDLEADDYCVESDASVEQVLIDIVKLYMVILLLAFTLENVY